MIYEGMWVDGKMQGKGRMIYPMGDYYTGSFILDKKHGKVKCF